LKSTLLNPYINIGVIKNLLSHFQNDSTSAIAFVSIKNGRLVVTSSHPGYRMELNYSKEEIKSLLTSFTNSFSDCNFMLEVEDIIISSVSSTSSKKNSNKNKKIETKVRIKERAKGNFKIDVKDTDIKRELTGIKKEIIRLNQSYKRDDDVNIGKDELNK